MTKRVCVVAGIGRGNGAAFARCFGAEGYAIALLARSSTFSVKVASTLPEARVYECDVTDAASVARTFDAVRRELGEVEVLVYNAGSGVWGSVEEASVADFEASWRVNTLGGFLAAKQVIPAMKRAGRGSIVFVGATASRKAGPRTMPTRRGGFALIAAVALLLFGCSPGAEDASSSAPPPARPVKRMLAVALNGSGSVRSEPPGIDCGTTCQASFDSGTSVSL